MTKYINMTEERISQKYTLKNIEVKQEITSLKKWTWKLMNWWVRSIKKVCGVSNDNEHLFISVSTVTGCVSISAFTSLIFISIGITGSAVELKIWICIKSISQSLRKRRRSMVK